MGFEQKLAVAMVVLWGGLGWFIALWSRATIDKLLTELAEMQRRMPRQ